MQVLFSLRDNIPRCGDMTGQQQEKHIGLTNNPFKKRYNTYTSTFSNYRTKNVKTLSRHTWILRDNEI